LIKTRSSAIAASTRPGTIVFNPCSTNVPIWEAIAAFKIALWSAETAEVHVALGEAYREAKDPDAARAEAQRALALDPASADAKALLKRLDSRE